MDTKIVVPQIAAPVWNGAEVAQAVSAKLAEYEGAVYTPDTIRNAKEDRAELNKLSKALDAERKRVKALYSAPYEAFEKEVKEIVKKIDDCSRAIDAQVKAFEEAEKRKKAEAIREMFDGMDFHGIEFDKIYVPSWANASVTLASVKKEMEARSSQIAMDFDVLEGVDEYQFEAIKKYKETLSLADAMSEVNRLKRMAAEREEYERKKAEHEARLRGEAEKKAKEPVVEAPAAAEPEEVIPFAEEPTVACDEDGLPDFEAIGDGRHALAIHMKVTNAEEMQVTQFLQSIGIEFYTVTN